MRGGSGRHDELAGELTEWWEDLWQRAMTSRVVLVPVPSGWGRTAVLDRLAAAAAADEAPVTLIARVSGRALPAEPGAQAAVMRETLAQAAARHRVAKLLGLDRLAGITQLAVGVGGLFVSGLAAAAGFLVTGMALGAAGEAWDDSPAGQDGALARTARAVAAASSQVPVVVIVDDAEFLGEDLAVTLAENLAARHDGHVLVVLVAGPGSAVVKALTARARQGLTEGRVYLAAADPDMSFESRLDLAAELCPHLPAAAARRIARLTATFKDVFTVTAVPRLARPGEEDETELLAAADAIAAAVLHQPGPSPEAVITAWAGGLIHARQAARALRATGQPPAADDPDLSREGNLQRVAGPDSPRLAGQVAALAMRDRQAMADAVLDEALRIVGDPRCGLAEQVAAAQAACHARGDLTDRARLPRLQRHLIVTLEALGEPAAALAIAVTALEEQPPGDGEDRDWLAAAVLRLTALTSEWPQPPLAAKLAAEAVAAGAGLGLEARVWAAVEMLRAGGPRAAALDFAGQVAAALDEHAAVLGPPADQWRLLLAFHAGRGGHDAIARDLLAPLLASENETRQAAANAVLRACGGPRPDTQLQAAVLEAELAALPVTADDDRLRIHHALALDYNTLGDYRSALAHGRDELSLRARIHSPDDPGTLTARGHVAYWTGESGNAAAAVGQFRELLRDQQRVLGLDHPGTLITRGNIARWTGDSGDWERGLALALGVLPDQERILGRSHPDTLSTRSIIAYLTGRCGDQAGALRLSLKLLPDQERVLGRDNPNTLSTRSNIADQTGRKDDLPAAIQLYKELLPDLERALGPDHPKTLAARGNLASATGRSGAPATANRLFQELLPDVTRVDGTDHPHTLTNRNNIAYWTARCGDPVTALRLFEELLPDQERVLGLGHPSIARTLNDITVCGDMLKGEGRGKQDLGPR